MTCLHLLVRVSAVPLPVSGAWCTVCLKTLALKNTQALTTIARSRSYA